jgi:hypothetical protein
MIRIRQGVVTGILSKRDEISEVTVRVQGEETDSKAVNYNTLVGPVKKGDNVILNTTALYKQLGTGGYHFIMGVMENEQMDVQDAGHLMKLRYTPSQVKTFGVDEQDSPHHEVFNDFTDLQGMPVVIGGLHSMVPGVAAAIKSLSNNKLKIAYIMTDGAALPMAFSRLVTQMKDSGLIDFTITIGNAFGGEIEAVNIYNGLIAAKEVCKADIVITAMGPGIVGTGTKYGFTGVEQGEIINAVNTLGGRPLLIPRISFADKRERHLGISHHTITVLTKIAKTPCTVVLPEVTEDLQRIFAKQIKEHQLDTLHQVESRNGQMVIDALINKYKLKVTTMGRGYQEEPEFFAACGAAGVKAVELLG